MEPTTLIILLLVLVTLVVAAVAIKTDQNLVYSSVLANRPGPDAEKGTIGMYCLPESVFEIEIRLKLLVYYRAGVFVNVAIRQTDVAVKVKTVTDSSRPFTLVYKANPFSNEEVKISVNENGLLENMDAASDNQAAKILTTIINAPADIVAHKNFMPGKLEDGQPREVQPKFTVKEIELSRVFQVNAWQTLGSVTVPWQFNVVRDDVGKLELVNIGFTLSSHIHAEGKTAEPEKEPSLSQASPRPPVAATIDGRCPGLLFRPKVSVDLTISELAGQAQIWFKGITIVDKRSLFNVPIRTAPFVNRKHKVAIKNGDLISHEIFNPSSVAGFVMIPVELAKAIVSVPAQIISFRIDMLSRKKDLQEVTNKLTEAQVKGNELEKKEAELREVDLKTKSDLLKTEKEVHAADRKRLQIQADCALEVLRLKQEIERLRK